MATSYQEPFLGTPTKRSHPVCKALLFSLFLAGVVTLTAFLTIQYTTTTLSPSSLCATSPNPASCHGIVSNSLTTTTTTTPTAAHVLQHVIKRSIHHLDAAVLSAGVVVDPKEAAAVADCLHLMDLTRDRLVASAAAVDAGNHGDSQTWLSAVLTNHETCLDGLRDSGAAVTGMEGRVKELAAMASASLAVLSSARPTAGDEVSQFVVDFPAWVTFKDRKLLGVEPVGAVTANVVVAQDGSGKFKTVQAAVDAAPQKSSARYVIYVKKGTYKENVVVGKTKQNIMIVGDGMSATVITGSRNVVDGATTFNSATLIAEGDGFILQDIAVENTAGPQKHQAVAVRTSADRTVVNRCRLDGYQDTLYTHNLRQFFRDSSVSGTVDFIFGNAAVVFQNCKLISRKPMDNQQNLVTAQGRTDPNQNTGTSVQNCQVVAASDLNPATIKSYLGRPWKEYSRTVFMQSSIEGHIAPKGWLEWDGNFALKTLYYAEYANKGPGAGTAGRVSWPGYHVITSAGEAMAFTVKQLIQGGSWLGSTGVAFTEGL